MDKTVLVIHGPNLNLLGTRETGTYGTTTLGEVDDVLRRIGAELGIKVQTFQANSEGVLVDRIQATLGKADGILVNPAA